MTNRMMMRVAALSAGLLLGGCALTTDRIDLSYSVPAGVAPVNGASAITVAVEVSDQRADKTKVSSKKNGFGMEMAPILANEDVALTVRRAIEQNLSARGFRTGAAGASVKVDAGLTRFYNDHKLGFFAGDAVAELNMNVSVRGRDGSVIYARQVVAQGTEPNTQLATGENARLALNRALESGMKQLFEDRVFLDALTGKRPPAGTAAL